MSQDADKPIDEVKQEETTKQKAVRSQNEAFKKNYEKAIVAWSKSHPGKSLPVEKDKDGCLHWVSREGRKNRRKLMKKKMIEMKRKEARKKKNE